MSAPKTDDARTMLATYYSDEALIKAALWTLVPRKHKPMWSLVMDRFCVGSTVAWLICRSFGVNGDATKSSDKFVVSK